MYIQFELVEKHEKRSLRMCGYILPNFPFSAVRVANRHCSRFGGPVSLCSGNLSVVEGNEEGAEAAAAATATQKRLNILPRWVGPALGRRAMEVSCKGGKNNVLFTLDCNAECVLDLEESAKCFLFENMLASSFSENLQIYT